MGRERLTKIPKIADQKPRCCASGIHKKNGTPLKDAVLGNVDDVPNLLQKGAFTLLTFHLVFSWCA